VEGVAAVVKGELKLDLKDVQVGGAGVPSQVVNAVQSNVQQYLAGVKLPDWMQDMKVTGDGKLTIMTK
jgi:hypothetical protein